MTPNLRRAAFAFSALGVAGAAQATGTAYQVIDPAQRKVAGGVHILAVGT